MMKAIITTLLIMAAAIFAAIHETKAQSANPFVPDYAFCNTRGSVATRGASKWQCLTPGTAGQVLSTNGAGFDASWQTISGTGTVTSVAATVPTFMTVRGSPITGAGTLAFSFNSQSANLIFASPDAASGAPTLRAMTLNDFPNIAGGTALGSQNIVYYGNASAAPPTLQSLSAVLVNGFGNTQGTLITRLASSWGSLTPGTSGQYLMSNGAAANLSWGTPLSSISTGTGLTGGPCTTTCTLDVATSATLDKLYATQGGILYRGASTWAGLGPGTAGQVLKSGGAAANPSWGSASSSWTNFYNSSVASTSAFVLTGLSGDTLRVSGVAIVGATATCASGNDQLQIDFSSDSGATYGTGTVFGLSTISAHTNIGISAIGLSDGHVLVTANGDGQAPTGLAVNSVYRSAAINTIRIMCASGGNISSSSMRVDTK